MVCPHTEPNDANGTHTIDHSLPSKDVTMDQARQCHTDKPKDRQDDNVYLWVTKEPEQVLLQYGISAEDTIVDTGTIVPIQEESRNSHPQDRQRAD